MSVSANMYAYSNAHAYNGEVKWDGGAYPIKVALLTNAYTFDHNHNYFNDVTAQEVSSSGTNYVQGGNELETDAIDINASSRVVTLSGTDLVFENLSVPNVKYAVIYQDTGTDSTSPLLGIVNFDSTSGAGVGGFDMSAEDLLIEWNAQGIYAMTADT